MVHLLKVSMLALFSGIVGTGVGGVIALFLKSSNKKLVSVMLEFAAGLMLSVVCFELLPEAFEIGGIPSTFAGVFSGIIVIIGIDDIIRRMDILKGNYKDKGLLRAGILMAIGIALHNFPEGFAVGSGFEASRNLGIILTLVIAIHDIPEGVAMTLPMRAGGFSAVKAFVLTVLSGVPMGFGAFFGALLGNISTGFIAGCLGFAGGAMLYIVSGEMIPESKRLYRGRLASVGNVLGIIAGVFVTIIG